MRATGFCVLVTVLGISQALAAPKVAVMYSAWGNYGFRDEFDAHLTKLQWPSEKFENKDVDAWIGRLGEFDMVIATSVANYENAQDMQKHAEAWRGFVQRGGAILVLDASYQSVLSQWMNRIWPDGNLDTAGCAPYTRKNNASDAIECDPAHPLLQAPNELPPLLRDHGSIWAHLEPKGTGWTHLITCADRQSLLVTRVEGKGIVVVTSYFSMKDARGARLAPALLENLWLQVQCRRAGVELRRVAFGPGVPGQHTASLDLRNTMDQEAAFAGRLLLARDAKPEESVAEASAKAAAGATVSLSLPYAISQRGPAVLRLGLSVNGQGVMELRRAIEVPPVLRLVVNDRHLYPWRERLTARAEFAPDTDSPLAKCVAEFAIDGESVLRVESPPAAGDHLLDVPGVAPGPHRLAVKLTCGDKLLGDASVEFLRHELPAVYSRADGTTMVHGQPFFPFGWYHVSWQSTLDEKLAFLRDIAAGGFNTVHASMRSQDDWDVLLGEAEKLGVYVVTEGIDAELKTLTRFRDRKAVLAWNPGDEPDGAGTGADELWRRYDRFKTADPDHPTYMVLCVPTTYAKYAMCAEVIAPDPYPVHHGKSAIGEVYRSLSAARAAAACHGRTLWAVPQCFGYQPEQKIGSWRIPTFGEVRNMTYQALVAGAKGLIYYTYHDSGFDVAKHPELWAGMKTLPAEIAALRPFLLDGQLAALESGQTDVRAGVWTAGGRAVVCVISTSSDAERSVAIALPASVKGVARPMFADRPHGLTLHDGRIEGTVKPLDVHVYQIAE